MDGISPAGPNASVFAYAAAQVKKAMEVTQELGGQGYVFWGGKAAAGCAQSIVWYQLACSGRTRQECVAAFDGVLEARRCVGAGLCCCHG